MFYSKDKSVEANDSPVDMIEIIEELRDELYAYENDVLPMWAYTKKQWNRMELHRRWLENKIRKLEDSVSYNSTNSNKDMPWI
jgi:hypothetical protein